MRRSTISRSGGGSQVRIGGYPPGRVVPDAVRTGWRSPRAGAAGWPLPAMVNGPALGAGPFSGNCGNHSPAEKRTKRLMVMPDSDKVFATVFLSSAMEGWSTKQLSL